MYGFIKIALMILTAAVLPLQPEQEVMREVTLFDFSMDKDPDDWRVVNDDVMGGRSSGEFLIQNDSIAVFRGEISLENNGGFSMVRTIRGEFGLAGLEGISLSVRGDGREYKLRLETDNTPGGVGYHGVFRADDNGWSTVKIPFDQFEPSFRGRKLRDAPRLKPAGIIRIGFLISDGQEGEFRLEIARIAGYSKGASGK